MMSKAICAVDECQHEAKYFMGWDNDEGKHFGFVCATHDKYYGRKNLLAAGMSLPEIMLFESYLKDTEDAGPDFPDWIAIHSDRAWVAKGNYGRLDRDQN